MELSEKCKQIIESDAFYYAVPLPENEEQIGAMWQLDNFLTSLDEPGVQTIDFDCVVCVNPTSERLEELKANDREQFDEILQISTKHIEATKCVVESNGIQFVYAAGQVIRFKKGNAAWVLDMKKDQFADWKFILFKRGKKPKVVPLVRMAYDQIEYFKIDSEASR